ncbi:MAG: 4Fe-4S binding protein [Candidatus Helarchaeota archaeon]|nr:4Fe-4S binding protein [Candidatus Helarchaeota archaeon]
MTQADLYETVRQKLSLGAITTPRHEKVIELMKVFWNEPEIKLLSHFPQSGKLISVQELVEKSGMPRSEVRSLMNNAAQRHTIAKIGAKYGLVPLIPGVFEGYFISRADSKENLAKAAILYRFIIKNTPSLSMISEGGQNKFGAAPITSPLLPYDAQTRLIKIDEPVNIEKKVLSTELVKDLIDRNDTFAALTCPCRLVAQMSGEPCSVAPAELGCFMVGVAAKLAVQAGFGRPLTKEQAIEFIRKTEEAGLVHNAMGATKDQVYAICNCCKCHCGALSPTNQTQMRLKFVSPSNFTPKHQPEQCTLCEKCLEMCPMDAISHPSGEDILWFNPTLCIGCGVCAANCPENAVLMIKARSNRQKSFETISQETEEISFKDLFQAIIVGP